MPFSHFSLCSLLVLSLGIPLSVSRADPTPEAPVAHPETPLPGQEDVRKAYRDAYNKMMKNPSPAARKEAGALIDSALKAQQELHAKELEEANAKRATEKAEKRRTKKGGKNADAKAPGKDADDSKAPETPVVDGSEISGTLDFGNAGGGGAENTAPAPSDDTLEFSGPARKSPAPAPTPPSKKRTR